MLMFSEYSVIENSICVNIIDRVCKVLGMCLCCLNRGGHRFRGLRILGKAEFHLTFLF